MKRSEILTETAATLISLSVVALPQMHNKVGEIFTVSSITYPNPQNNLKKGPIFLTRQSLKNHSCKLTNLWYITSLWWILLKEAGNSDTANKLNEEAI